MKLTKFNIKINDTLNDLYTHLIEQYKIKQKQLTLSSPYIQTLNFINEFKEIVFTFLSDSINESNITTARKRRSINGLAQLTGHNVMRANCAKGVIELLLNINNVSLISGQYIVIPPLTELKNSKNNLTYTLIHSQNILLNKDDDTLNVSIPVVQGSFKKKTFISNGLELQSFNITPSTRDVMIDNEYIIVTVNGKRYTNHESLYDILDLEHGVLVRTSLEEGIDIIFGNQSFGGIPSKGATIEITWLETNGVYGNLYNDLSDLNFTWQNDLFDDLGNELNGEDIFNIVINNEIAFGTNQESTLFTKLILNKYSQVNVLGNANSYILFFQRMGLFSYIYAYDNNTFNNNNDIINLILVPDVKRKLSYNNYFELPESSFLLTDYEKDYYKDLVIKSGKQLPNSTLKIINPAIKKYILNINITIFNTVSELTIKQEITNKLSDYFYLIRRSRLIPKSDIIRLIEPINGVNSVNVHFLSYDNELARTLGYYQLIENNTAKTINISETDNPRLGLNEFGDIILNDNEIAVIKGGWYDSNEIYYDDKITSDLSGLNINVIQVDNYTLLDEINQNNIRLL